MRLYIVFIIAILACFKLHAQTQAEKDSINALYDEEPYPYCFYQGVKLPKMYDMDIQDCSPTEMRALKQDPGHIVFRALIDENGCCIKHFRTSPKKGPKEMMDFVNCIESQLPYIIFLPATKDGIPVKSWTIVPLQICWH